MGLSTVAGGDPEMVVRVACADRASFLETAVPLQRGCINNCIACKSLWVPVVLYCLHYIIYVIRSLV